MRTRDKQCIPDSLVVITSYESKGCLCACNRVLKNDKTIGNKGGWLVNDDNCLIEEPPFAKGIRNLSAAGSTSIRNWRCVAR